jgi:uncharacterized protein (DUF885 family)
MRRLLVLLLMLPAYGFSHSPASGGAKAPTASAALKELFEQSDAADLDRNPMKALERGDTRYAARLGYDLSDSHFARERSATATDLRRLRSIDRAALPPADQIAYDAFKWRHEMDRKLLAPAIVDLLTMRPVEHFTGFHLDYADLASGLGVAPFKTVADYEDNLERHRQYAAFIDTVIVRLRQGMARDIVQPKIIVARVIKELDDQIAPGVDGSLFLAPVNNFPQSIPPEARERLKEQYRGAIRDELLPALSRLDTFLREEYLPRARDSIGLSEMPGGRNLYRLAIEENTTLPLTAEYVHRFGLAEVARITAEMEIVKASAGFQGSLHDFFVFLRSDPRFRVSDDEWALKRFESEQEQIDRHLEEQFASLPKSRLQIQPEPEYKRPPGGRKTGASGYYQGGTPDGSRPGIFFFEVATTPEMDSLFLHEGMPGHHLQVSLAQENSQLPAFMRFGDCAAYDEGWALYAETLWREMGVESDPIEQFGGLSAQLTRAIRLVVDTGIHARGWSRERAIQYIVDHSPAGRDEAASAVDRYIATPGQALAYQIGLSTILELKAKAKAAFGARFDARAFHEQVLNTGSLPLPVLSAKLNRWMSREHGIVPTEESKQRDAP